LPDLLRSRANEERRLRIWSAACCSGEEPYSIAISLRKTIPNLADWNATILGTDINPRFLHKGARGIFSEWSFRDTPAGFKEKNFERFDDKHWEILPEFKQMVTFSSLNLATDIYPSMLNNTNAVDIIFCRNVLIYFAPDLIKKVVRGLAQCLVEGGWLILSATESSLAAFPELEPVRFPGTILFQKRAGKLRQGGGMAPRWEEGLAGISESVVEQTAAVIDRPYIPPAPPEPEPVIELPAVNMSEEARGLANQGRLQDALSCCDRLVSAEKMNPNGHYLRGTILQEQGALGEAAATFRRTLYLDPDFLLAHFALGNLARRQGRFAEADKHFGHALLLARKHPAEEILPESEGLTAGRLSAILAALQIESAATKP
jgi:chemotaxis protein methyltransferase CheR